MSDAIGDAQTGISIRFIRAYSPETRTLDKAVMLAMADAREMSFVEKMRDALTCLRQGIH